MIVQFYNNISENIRVDKTDYITLLYTYDCLLKQSTSILTPTLILNVIAGVVSYNDIPIVDDNNNIVAYGLDIFNCNYVYIPQFKRYYYISNITSINNNIWSIDLNIDVLMSYKDEILKLNGMIARNEFIYNDYLVDNAFPNEYDIEVNEYIPTNINSDYDITNFDLSSVKLDTSCYVINIINNIQAPINTYTINPPISTLNQIKTFNFPNGFDKRYVLDTARVLALSASLIDDYSDYSSFIKSLVLYPFEIPHSTIQESLYLGNQEITTVSGYYPTPNFSPYFNIAYFKIPHKYNDYRDLSPYSVYEIWLPFHGWYTLDANKCIGVNLLITYVLNYDNGSAQIFINDDTNNILIDTIQAQIGIQVGINQVNTQEVERNARAQSLNLISGSISSIIPLGVGLLTGNVIAMGVGAYSLYKTIETHNIAQANNILTGNGKLSDSQVGLYGSSKVRLRVSRKKWGINDNIALKNYLSLYGKPLYQYHTLKDLHGLTVIDNIHIENINSTSNEKDEIETLLKNGIIL